MTRVPFEKVVQQHGDTVLRVCRAIVGFHDAQDAWSETFLGALRAYPALPDGANIEAWLVTIAHHKAIDITRARARAPIPVDDAPETRSTVGLPAAPDPLWDQVAALPPRQRQAVAYHYLAGLPYSQVADVIGGSADAARRAAADGIAALRRNHRPPHPKKADSR